MALASIMIGIAFAAVSFGGALLAGQGFAVAFGFYVLGGMIGALVVMVAALLRAARKPHPAQAIGLASAQA